MDKKNTWEFLLLAHPSLQALALPPPKDKQRSQPTSWHIIQRHLPLCSVTDGYNTPNADVPLPHLLGFVKFARFEDLKITSVNVLFSTTALMTFTKHRNWIHNVTHQPLRADWVFCKITNYLILTKYLKHFISKSNLIRMHSSEV